MATSISLTPEIEATLEQLMAHEPGISRSDLIRQAIVWFSREKAFERLQQAERDIVAGRVYEGDLKNLIQIVR